MSCSGSAPALTQKRTHTQTPSSDRHISTHAKYFHVVLLLILSMIATSSKMLGIIRKVLGCLGRLWLCVIGVLCRGKRRHGAGGGEGELNQRKKETHDMNWDAEGWDDFSVTVVPSVATGADQSQSGERDEQTPTENHEEQDLFQDMRPVFRKSQKVRAS